MGGSRYAPHLDPAPNRPSPSLPAFWRPFCGLSSVLQKVGLESASKLEYTGWIWMAITIFLNGQSVLRWLTDVSNVKPLVRLVLRQHDFATRTRNHPDSLMIRRSFPTPCFRSCFRLRLGFGLGLSGKSFDR